MSDLELNFQEFLVFTEQIIFINIYRKIVLKYRKLIVCINSSESKYFKNYTINNKYDSIKMSSICIRNNTCRYNILLI